MLSAMREERVAVRERDAMIDDAIDILQSIFSWSTDWICIAKWKNVKRSRGLESGLEGAMNLVEEFCWKNFELKILRLLRI